LIRIQHFRLNTDPDLDPIQIQGFDGAQKGILIQHFRLNTDLDLDPIRIQGFDGALKLSC
jgi:hypothetical protein